MQDLQRDFLFMYFYDVMKFPSIAELYEVYKKHPVISTDSRDVEKASLFFALKGESFNGNKYAVDALKAGAAFSVLDEEMYYRDDHCILVKDTLETLQELSANHRSQMNIPFIGITGSNGKTTTKELIRNVLVRKYRTHATSGNLNNHIGVPLTLLSMKPDTEIAVIEMGANHVGEIAMLCRISNPGFGIITNIGKAHVGEFGGFENIIKAKTELYDSIRNHKGKVFVCADNPLLVAQSEGIERIEYGTKKDIFCRCEMDTTDPFLSVRYGNRIIHSKLIGNYNFENIVAAICIGKYFGVPEDAIQAAIEEYVPSNNRSQIIKTESNTLVMDAYNANPSSMKAAIDNFYMMKGGTHWLILGDMLELGDYEAEEHQNIIRQLQQLQFSNVILVGERFNNALIECDAGFQSFSTSEELGQKLKSSSLIGKGNLILIKGSRGMKLEKVVEYL